MASNRYIYVRNSLFTLVPLSLVLSLVIAWLGTTEDSLNIVCPDLMVVVNAEHGDFFEKSVDQPCRRLIKVTLWSSFGVNLVLSAFFSIGIWKGDFCNVTAAAVLYTIFAVYCLVKFFTALSWGNGVVALVACLMAGLCITLSHLISLKEGDSFVGYGV